MPEPRAPAPPPPPPARLLARLTRIERGIAVLAFALMAAAVLVDVGLRAVAGVGLAGAREVAVFAMVLLVLAAVGIATDSRAHLRPQFADRWLPARWDAWLWRLADALSAAVLAAAAFFAMQMVATTAALDERSPVLGVPLWPLQAALPLALLGSALRFACAACWPACVPRGNGPPT